MRIWDYPDQDLISYLPLAHRFIDEALETGSVFVHWYTRALC